MRKIHVTRQFFEASGPQGHSFEKTNNRFLDKDKYVYQISDPYRFSFGQEAWHT